jgi:hypothetical protein
MQNSADKWNWKRHPFILGFALLFIAAMIAALSGGESGAAADSSACDAFFVGAAIEQTGEKDITRLKVVHAISKEKGLVTFKWEGVAHSGGVPYYQPMYFTWPCSKLKNTYHISTK